MSKLSTQHRRTDRLAALVSFSDDAVGLPATIGINSLACPFMRLVSARQVFENEDMPVLTDSGGNDTRFVASFGCADRRINSNDDSFERQVGGHFDAVIVDPTYTCELKTCRQREE
jgi:hypothetical protein